ncbi:Thiol-disulfide isomerase or thioredoxin [Chitinophaga sp. CF118]|uniref:TlpA family protein disulfide reductase n=1 Tax=Chitinophaga sp. CF118 TaxID=1884367 RepID=UPI0008E93A17|nr:thioredoxin fold domain-containing protein [Chitinophaga sp. CF118]SFE44832.1 Thiol-disulfide isomerase or thioredoxin [Chitinophaga sp. CF118]
MRITILTLCIIGFLAGCTRTKLPKTGLEGKPMPSFSLLSSDSVTYLNTNNIPAGKPIVFLLFDPYCPYCRAETESIIKNMKSLQDVRFYFLTSSPYNDMMSYYKNFQLQKYENVTVGIDTGFYLIKYFKIAGVPFTAIYTDEKKLKQTFVGKIEAEVIKDITGS